MTGVGSKKVFENDRVIVWHLDLEPGERGEMHTHELDFAVRVFSGSTVEVIGPDGDSLYTVKRDAGDVVHFRVEGDQLVSDREGGPTAPATHSARNLGATPFREVLIEFKKER